MPNPIVEQIALAVTDRLRPYLLNGNGGNGGGSTPPARNGKNVIPRSLTVKETAVYIGRSETAVYRLVAKRQIPSVRNGRTLRFLRDDIDRWLEGDRV
jgi:excisionase family DNA binding protein